MRRPGVLRAACCWRYSCQADVWTAAHRDGMGAVSTGPLYNSQACTG